jgi:hypothetical protein
MAPTTRTLHDWLSVHRTLLEAEEKLATMAGAFAAGMVTQAELNEQHRQVLALRELARTVFEAAVGRQNGAART